jgi:hypothetical protein
VVAAAARARVNVAGGTVAGEIIPETARIAGGTGGRTERRVIALLGAVIDATQDVAFRLMGVRLRAREALAGRGDWLAVLEEVIALNDLDNPHRAIYALGRFDETETGQLALSYTNQRPIAA